ncbi:MAG: SDR family NAD(P)-dependent oxidoreductase [Frankiaceae bacterium]
MNLSGAVALVTGASGGIGRASCERLAVAGATVIASGTRAENLTGLPGIHVAADLAAPDGVRQLAADALAAHGRVDLLVHCAGIGLAGEFAGAGSGRIGELVEVNVRAPMQLTALLLPPMLARRSGAIVAVASIAGAVGVPGETAYSASKAAVRAFCEALRAEVRPAGVTVSCVLPGPVDTGFFTRRGVPYDRRWPRPVPPAKVAEAIVRAAEHGAAEVFVPGWLTLAARLRGGLPGIYRVLASRFG